ncbi:1-phosphatidylinositol 3-phosphate 5-kinase-like [Anabrus simplex]|uniref:1-phosphatidylinositol 3-phosphate 5-kinase-like n=1 Tax=Anabrus simplex TaxID=316456 RepID=UPI0035A2D12D
MRPGAEVADKAVSTEDLDFQHDDGETVTNTALELVRLEAVLAALVESKVVAIKAASSHTPNKKAVRPRSHSTFNHHHHNHDSSNRHQRLASSSTASSSHNDHPYHHHHHHHHHRHHHRHHRKRQSDSALLSSGLFPRKRYRHHHHRHHYHHSREREEGEEHEALHDDQETAFGGAEIPMVDSPPPDMAGPSTDSPRQQGYHNYSYYIRQTHHHQVIVNSSCCPSPTHSQSKMVASRYDTDYVSLHMERTREEEEEEEEEEMRRRKKRRRKRRKAAAAAAAAAGALEAARPKRMLDPEDLPKRARWTIIATACLLLLMSVLLVGVTLRMAPIIDEMGLCDHTKSNSAHVAATVRFMYTEVSLK